MLRLMCIEFFIYLFLQKEVFGDLGVGILKNAWEGYNTSLFAYGQTGSGKSWSVIGYGINKGKKHCIALHHNKVCQCNGITSYKSAFTL